MIHANGSVQSNRDPLHAVADVMVGHTPPGCYLPLPPLLALSTLPYPTSIILGCMPQCPLYVNCCGSVLHPPHAHRRANKPHAAVTTVQPSHGYLITTATSSTQCCQYPRLNVVSYVTAVATTSRIATVYLRHLPN